MKTCCDEIAEKFYEYMDQELSPQKIRELEDHLKACGGCRGHLEFERAARFFLKKKASQLEFSPSVRDLIFRQFTT